MNKHLAYVVIGFICWLAAEFVTVWAWRGVAEWLSYMPLIFAFYIGYPLLFSYLIFSKGWGTRRLFAASMLVGFGLELTFFQNRGLNQLPAALYLVPVLVIIYAFLTFAPRYLVSRAGGK